MSLLSRGILLALVAATHDGGDHHETSSFYFKLGQRDEEHLSFNPITYYDHYENTQCQEDGGIIQVAFHDDPAIRESQCYLKCLVNRENAPAYCAGYQAYCDKVTDDAVCQSGSNVVCVGTTMEEDKRRTIEALCNSIDDCYGYTMLPEKKSGSGKSAVNAWLGVLNTFQCTQESKSKSNLWVKPPQGADVSVSCPLGTGLEVSGDSFPSMAGLYEADETDLSRGGVTNYLHVDNDNFIGWSSCGWTGYQFTAEGTTCADGVQNGDETGVDCGGSCGACPGACQDDNKLMNILLGQCNDPADCETNDPDYEPDVCAKTTVWGHGYCANLIFARVCAATCNAPCDTDATTLGQGKTSSDAYAGQGDDAASAQYAEMIGLKLYKKSDGSKKSSLTYCQQLAGLELKVTGSGNSRKFLLDLSEWEADTGCDNAIVARMCPESCPTTPPADCVDSTFVAEACPEVCEGQCARRLSTAQALAPAKLRAQLRKEREARAARSTRRLAVSMSTLSSAGAGEFHEVFYTHEAQFASIGTNVPCQGQETQILPYPLQEVYDVQAWQTAQADMTFALSCDNGVAFRTEQQSEEKFCPLNNIPAAYNTNPDVVKNQCFRKCNHRVEFNTTLNRHGNPHAITPPPLSDYRFADFDADLDEETWCSGHSADFTKDTDAICLPRNECEDLCANTPGCVSIDMHRRFPRCYLNKQASGCGPGNAAAYDSAETDTAYDIVIKFDTPGPEAPTIADDVDRVIYTSYQGQSCDTTGASASSETRRECEAACTNAANCKAYQFTASCGGAISEDGDGKEVIAGCSKTGSCVRFTTTPTGCTESYESLVVLATKVKPRPCQVDVTGGIELANCGETSANGEPEIFMTADHTKRLVYQDGSSGIGRCAGWQYQENIADLVPKTFQNCSDTQLAAKHYLTGWWVNTYEEERQAAYVQHEADEDQNDADALAAGPAPWNVAPHPSNYTRVPFSYDLCGPQGHSVGTCSSVAPAPDWEFPCQWAFEQGLCDEATDVGIVLIGLCPHTCTPLERDPAVSGPFSGQDINAGLYTGRSETCKTSEDNNYGMYKFRNDATKIAFDQTGLPEITGAIGTACNAIAEGASYFNHTHSPCHLLGPVSAIVRALCPASCDISEPLPPSEAPPTTEADTQGAQQRRLQADPGYTTSNGGKASKCSDLGPDRDESVGCINGNGLVQYVQSYLPANHRVPADWRTIRTTFRPPSRLGAQGTTVDADGDKVSDDVVACQNPANKYKKLGLGASPQEDTFAPGPALVATTIGRVCRANSVCPTLTTCVLNRLRMHDEMELFYGRHGVAKAAFVSDIDQPERDAVMDPTNFEAKVLLSEHRATAFIDAAKSDFVRTVHRVIPGATRVKFLDGTDFGDKMIVTVADGHNMEAKENLGRQYEEELLDTLNFDWLGVVQPLWEDWHTDVIRVERFNADGTPDDEGEVHVQVWVEGITRELVFWMFPTVPDATPTRVASVTPRGQGWYDVVLPRANADFVGTQDLDECSATPSWCARASTGEHEVDATCVNQVGAAPLCSCPSPEFVGTGYAKDGAAGTCTLAPLKYAPETEDYYIRIRHTDRLDYGWRVSQLTMYQAGCSGSTTSAGTFPAQAGSATYDQLVSSTNVFTGLLGHAQYPSNTDAPGNPTYGGNKLFSKNGEWRSACLNCNPDVVDATHGGAAEILFVVSGDESVGCLEITQDPNHAAKGIQIDRGPVSGENCGVDIEGGKPLCKPTMSWTQTLDTTQSKNTVPMDCGVADTEFMGELLILDGTEHVGQYGSWGAAAGANGDFNVPSACHCQALCLSLVDQGCRSYKYDSETETGTAGKNSRTGHCYLQSNIFDIDGTKFFEPGARGVGISSGFTSATPALRTTADGKLKASPYLRRFAASPQPQDGVTFSLTLQGVGLPYSAKKAEDTSEFQRIKVLRAGQQCHEPIPQEVSGIGCAKSTRKVTTSRGTREQTVHTICSPRPSETSAEAATWAGITVTAASVETDYQVCYCAGNCFNPSAWELVPGTFNLNQAVFRWDTVPETVYRKDAASGGLGALQVNVGRNAYGSFSGADDWQLKLVREYFDCSKVMDGDQFQCATSQGIDSSDDEAPTVAAHGEADGTAYEYAASGPNTGFYTITFSEPITTDGCTGSWNASHTAVPCADVRVSGNTALVPADDADNGFDFTFEWPEGVVHDMHGNPVAAGTLTFSAVDPTAPVLTWSTLLSGQTFDGTITLAFNERVAFSDNITVTNVDSGKVYSRLPFGSASEHDVTVPLLQGETYELTVPASTTGLMSGATVGADVTVTFTFGCPKASVINGPDSASWAYDLDISSGEVGKFQVCFREGGDQAYKAIPSSTGEKYVTIHKVDADTTPTRGVFHNQRFSGLIGAPFEDSFNVSGTRLSVPSGSKVLLTTGSCSDPAVPPVFTRTSDDTAAPSLASVTPALATSGGAATVDTASTTYIKLTYDERITTADCTGNITLKAGADTIEIGCDEAVAYGNSLYLEVSFANAGCYFVKVPTGSVMDEAGNKPGEYNSEAATINKCIEVAVGATFDPAIVYSDPMPGGQFRSDDLEGIASIMFNEAVLGQGGFFLELVDCGADFACTATDPAMYRFEASELMTAPTSKVEVNLTGKVDGYRRYLLKVPAGAFQDAGSTDSLAYDLEFVNDNSEFEFAKVLSADTAASDAGNLNFPFRIAAGDAAAGHYSVCFCNDQEDASLEDRGDGASTYIRDDEMKVTLAADLLDSATATATGIGGKDLAEHECNSKCRAGCTGPHCYCDGYDAANAAGTIYCLPPALCNAACDAEAACAGFNVHDTLPQCLLATSAAEADRSADESWQFFRKDAHTACTQAHDFRLKVGTFTLTSRVDVAVDYILEPGVDASIEVTAPEDAESSLTYATSKSLSSADRVTIIDYYGTCGLSSPSASVTKPANAQSIATWASDFVAHSYFHDAPAPPNPADRVVDQITRKARNTYNKRESGKYCPGHNLDLDDPAYRVAIDGVQSPVKQHQCYQKCAINAPCVGDECFCDGYYSGYDTDSSNAICGDEALCQYLCDQIDDCKSIDMHNNNQRCFLNSFDGCALHTDDLEDDASYTLLIKTSDDNDEQHLRRLKAPADFSWSTQLRFGPVQIDSGGTFKLCFCDSTLAPGGVCSTVADFSVEVGTIHSSGISCLLKEESLQRVSCVSQTDGGLRCYDSYTAPQSSPTVATFDYRPEYEEAIADAEAARANTLAMMQQEIP